MKVEKNKIKLKTNDWSFKVRDKGRRMKIYIKLNQQESSQWSSIKTAVIGEGGGMPDADFAKIMLFRGLNSFMDDVNKAIDDMSDEEKEKVLKEAGIEPVEDEVEVEVPDISKLKTDENTENTDE